MKTKEDQQWMDGCNAARKERGPEKYTKNCARWSFARGVVVGVFATCSAIIGLLELAVAVKELIK